MMHKLIILLGATLISVCLSGCVATTFGIPTKEWNKLTPSQQSQAQQEYYRQQREKAEMDNALSLISSVIPRETKTWDSSHSKTTSSCSGNTCESNTNSSGSSFSVGF